MSALRQFDLIDNVWDPFEKPISSYYQIGDFSLCLEYVNRDLGEKLSRAFNHLKRDPLKDPSLTIRLFDTKKSGVKLPPLDWNLIHLNGYRGYYEKPIYLHYFEQIEALSVLNSEQNRAYYIVKDPEILPWWVSGSPFQVILHAWFREQGMQLTHTAAVGNKKSALLLTGKGGSGKSTTTLACVREGLDYLGEDYSLLSVENTPKVFSVYQSAKWRPGTRKMFPDHEKAIVNPDTADCEKALLYYQDLFPTQIETSSSIRAIISLKIGNQEFPLLKPSDPQSSLKSMMMSTLSQLPFYSKKTLLILQNITRQIESFELVLGHDIKANVSTIKELLK